MQRRLLGFQFLAMIIAILASVNLAFAQTGLDSTTTTIPQAQRRWVLGTKISGSSSNIVPGILVRYQLSEQNGIEVAGMVYGRIENARRWEANFPGNLHKQSENNYGLISWKFDIFWRHQSPSNKTLKSYYRIGLGSYDSDNGRSTSSYKYLNLNIGPEGSYGWEWRPSDTIGIFAEFGCFAFYTYERSKSYSTTSEGKKYINYKYVNHELYMGVNSAFGLSFYL